ncbi:MAG: hypothetical protein ABSF71_17605 [Terriglobia bacterium]|jgi:hypothetical protein
MGDFIAKSLIQTLHTFSQMVTQFLPRLLAMIIIVVVGWVVAWLAKVILPRILNLVRFNSLFVRAGVAQVLTKAALPNPSELLARLVFWVLWITFILFGLEALQIVALQEEISGLFRILPQIFVALVILFAGVLIANFVSRATLLAAVNANSPSPRLVSTLVRFVIIALTVTMALERVGLGRGVVLIAFSSFFGAIMLGLALAFGLGGRDLARQVLERRFLEEKKEEDQGISHL